MEMNNNTSWKGRLGEQCPRRGPASYTENPLWEWPAGSKWKPQSHAVLHLPHGKRLNVAISADRMRSIGAACCQVTHSCVPETATMVALCSDQPEAAAYPQAILSTQAGHPKKHSGHVVTALGPEHNWEGTVGTVGGPYTVVTWLS